MKICYVVHRYPPFAGGSEYYVQGMAEESLRRGHEVTVFTGEHAGDLNGVRVTSDGSVFKNGELSAFDLIVVHGADVWVQNLILENIKELKTPVLYMIILPSSSHTAMVGMRDAQIIGCSTKFDWNHVQKYASLGKCAQVRHSLPCSVSDALGSDQIGHTRKKFDIETKYMIVSCGGYWPNKAMHELVDSFNKAGISDTTLVLTGYANREQAPKESEFVKVLMVEDRQDALDLIAAADLYVMHSHQEGFGLVLLEAMLNETLWISRRIAGAVELGKYGLVYETEEEFIYLLKRIHESGFVGVNTKRTLEEAKRYVLENRLIGNTVDDIEKAYADYKARQ